MKKAILVLVISIISISVGSSQPVETTYSGSIIKEGSADDVSYGPFNIGFSFTFFETVYSQFYVNSNGMITFGSGSSSPTPLAIPSASAPNNFIAAFWDNLRISGTGDILYRTIGSSSNRKTIIQFRNMSFYGYPNFMGTFHILLYEDGRIQTQYRLIVAKTIPRATGGNASIGIENSTGGTGVQYSYLTNNMVATGKAILYTPNGSSYTINSNALYEGIVLTSTISFPEPAITELISPASGATIGVNHTFEWEEAEYADSYLLLISTDPTLFMATEYLVGPEASKSVTGLLPETTYYWSVFSRNTFGSIVRETWNEIKSFQTSLNPPLSAVPRTVWVELGTETASALQYTGGDGSTVTATITSLPSEGGLYQVVGGLKGTLITSVPSPVSDPELRLIYVADGATGNGAGSFNFFVTDGSGASPEATITINVSPAGIPSVLFFAKSSGVEIQFDRPMNNPAGKETQFLVEVNGSPTGVTAANLKSGDNTTIVLTLASPLTGSESVNVSYTQGDVTATTGGVLLSFTAVPVTLLAQSINFPEITPKKYGAPDYAPGASAPGGAITYSSSNLNVATIVSNLIRFTGIGTATITARQAGSATYAPARFERILTVVKGDQIITFNALTAKTYGDDDFLLTATSSSGLPVSFASDNPLAASVTGNNVQINGAGSAIITASQAGNSLWNPAPNVPQNLTVNKVTLTVTAADATKPYLDPIPSLTFTIEGFVSGETQTVIDVLPTASTTANASSDVGEYPITISGGSDNNYDFSFVSGVLDITIINQTITFDDVPSFILMGNNIEISATSTSGLVVSFESQNTNIATITGTTLTGLAKGTATIRAFNAGNINYLPAEAFETIEVTTTHRDILYLFTPNNDGINDLWEIPDLTDLGKCDVRVFNRWGKPVYANSDYNNEWDGNSEGKPLPEGAYPFIIKTENQGTVTGTVNIVR